MRVADPLTLKADVAERTSRAGFWYDLARRPVVCYDEAFHGLLIYFDGEDPSADCAARVAAMKSRGMLLASFNRPADEAADRGTLAVALAEGLKIRGGLTMRLAGASPRYAVRALQQRGVYPPSSPNQLFSGAEWVAVMGRAEDYQRNDPDVAVPHPALARTDLPQAPSASSVEAAAVGAERAPTVRPVLLSAWNAALLEDPAPADEKLTAVVTAVQGQADLKVNDKSPWKPAEVLDEVEETGEFRTGDKSRIEFNVLEQVYTLDRQSSMTLLKMVYDGKKVSSAAGLAQGRAGIAAGKDGKASPPRAAGKPPRVRAPGVQDDGTIQTPGTSLAIRGTVVGIDNEPGFEPEAASLRGRAEFRDLKRQTIPFGGSGKASAKAGRTGAAETALEVSARLPGDLTAVQDFSLQNVTLALTRDAFQRGDVITGNSRVTDAALVPRLPGVLDFVLRWDGGPERKLNDLSLVVFSPLNKRAAPDFVGNPPFALSLTPGDPQAEATRAALYPRSSPSGGRISKNHIGPEGLEFAAWPRNYPAGNYRVVVYNLLDAVPAPTQTINPVNYTIDVFLNKRILINTVTGSVGELQTSPAVVVPVPVSGSAGVSKKGDAAPKPVTKKR